MPRDGPVAAIQVADVPANEKVARSPAADAIDAVPAPVRPDDPLKDCLVSFRLQPGVKPIAALPSSKREPTSMASTNTRASVAAARAIPSASIAIVCCTGARLPTPNTGPTVSTGAYESTSAWTT